MTTALIVAVVVPIFATEIVIGVLIGHADVLSCKTWRFHVVPIHENPKDEKEGSPRFAIKASPLLTLAPPPKDLIAGFIQNPLDAAVQNLLIPAATSIIKGLHSKKDQAQE
jgi:hypothetical protein